mmetsp:Transcript_13484/g.13212  ORF Transcript_13484/g.13212 Transcript_13484/m.13212 type:complete len:143 (+) Transcript_13484:2399-2827(+)
MKGDERVEKEEKKGMEWMTVERVKLMNMLGGRLGYGTRDVKCLKHRASMGMGHLCDDELRNAMRGLNVEKVMVMKEEEVCDTNEGIRARLEMMSRIRDGNVGYWTGLPRGSLSIDNSTEVIDEMRRRLHLACGSQGDGGVSL